MTDVQRQQLAERLATVHSRYTGAPVGFAQCVFHDVDPSRHFIGGVAASSDGVWILGFIRSGRTRAVKDRLLSEIVVAATELLNIPATVVWVYLSELDHRDMVEFGLALPPDGGEARWLERLPPGLRAQVDPPWG